MMALVTGLTFYRPLVGPFESLQARTNLVYWNLVAFVLLPFVSLSLYTNDKKLYLADVSAKLYRPGAFYVAKVGALAFSAKSQRCLCTGWWQATAWC